MPNFERSKYNNANILSKKTLMGAVLVMVPVAVYRHHDHNNFKEKSVIRASLQFQRISPLLSL